MIEVIFSIIIAVIFITAYVSQIKVIKDTKHVKDVDGISVPFWISLNLALWLTLYNFIITDSHLTVIIPQAINAGVGLFVLFIVLDAKGFTGFRKRYTLLIIVSATLLFSIASVYVSQTFASGFVIAAYLSQIMQIARTKNVEGLSVGLFSFIALALVLMITNIFITDSYSLANVTETFNLILIVTIIVQIFVYRNKGEELT